MIMSVHDTLSKIENLAAGAPHLPLTSKMLISEVEFINLVDELRKELPAELEHAEEVMKERDNILQNAQAEANNIIKQAQLQAEQLMDENDIVVKAREKSRMVLSQAQQQEAEIMERTRQNAKQLQDDADRYANQVFDQLIAHVTSTFQGVQQAQVGLENARQILQQAKIQMNQQAAQQSYSQSYGAQQGYNQQYEQNSQGYNQQAQYQQEQRWKFAKKTPRRIGGEFFFGRVFFILNGRYLETSADAQWAVAKILPLKMGRGVIRS